MSVEGLMNQTVQVERRLSTGDDGLPDSYSDPEKRLVKVEPFVKLVLDSRGERAPARARVFLEPEVEVDTGDRITLPDGSAGEVLQVTPVYDGNGEEAYKVVVL